MTELSRPKHEATHLFDGVPVPQIVQTVATVLGSLLLVCFCGWILDLYHLKTTPWVYLTDDNEIEPKKLLWLSIVMGVTEVFLVGCIVIAIIWSWHWYEWLPPVGMSLFLYGEMLWIRYFYESPHPYDF